MIKFPCRKCGKLLATVALGFCVGCAPAMVPLEPAPGGHAPTVNTAVYRPVPSSELSPLACGSPEPLDPPDRDGPTFFSSGVAAGGTVSATGRTTLWQGSLYPD